MQQQTFNEFLQRNDIGEKIEELEAAYDLLNETGSLIGHVQKDELIMEILNNIHTNEWSDYQDRCYDEFKDK